MNKPNTYIGIDNEVDGGMTTIGKLIRDAKIFGLIEDSETCKGWNLAGIDSLLEKVNKQWDKYGCLASNLPKELALKHYKIHDEAIQKAKQSGWSGEQETDDEE